MIGTRVRTWLFLYGTWMLVALAYLIIAYVMTKILSNVVSYVFYVPAPWDVMAGGMMSMWIIVVYALYMSQR